ncbi:MAG: DUF177 domain-containing protein [Bacilli bacterium]|nr:DUF177 domain-containing protein [Bacilli bacterium]
MILEVNKLVSTKPFEESEDITFDKEKYKCVLPLIEIKKCHVKVDATNYNDFIEVMILVDAVVLLESSYTLKPFEFHMLTGEEYHFGTSAYEGDDVIEYKGNIIKLDDYIFNLISASIPLSPKAPGETLPKSGKGYRILSEDDYEKEKQSSGDPRFSKLDDIDFN